MLPLHLLKMPVILETLGIWKRLSSKPRDASPQESRKEIEEMSQEFQEIQKVAQEQQVPEESKDAKESQGFTAGD